MWYRLGLWSGVVSFWGWRVVLGLGESYLGVCGIVWGLWGLLRSRFGVLAWERRHGTITIKRHSTGDHEHEPGDHEHAHKNKPQSRPISDGLIQSPKNRLVEFGCGWEGF